ncbi:MAG: hypothetical protein DWQ02_07660 [Bacteroidetes bacterium]|nr:MAG: hypothetical protein DWQ02_07660 [Bacteroidota bacterium]
MVIIGRAYVFNISGDNISDLKINGNKTSGIRGWPKKGEFFKTGLYIPYDFVVPIYTEPPTDDDNFQMGGMIVNKPNKFEITWESGLFQVTVFPIVADGQSPGHVEFVIYLNFNCTLLLDNRGHILGQYHTGQS